MDFQFLSRKVCHAEIQTWSVDVEAETATVVSTRKRRVRPAQAALDVDALAEELATAITENRQDDGRIRWSSDGRVQIRFAEVLPRASKQTTEGRRKRLNLAVLSRLQPLGWKRGTGGWWEVG